jgi:hypothetical protein
LVILFHPVEFLLLLKIVGGQIHNQLLEIV